MEVRSSNEDKKGATELELKPLPSHLRYEFLGPNHTFPIIVSVKLNGPQVEKLLNVLCKHRGTIGYSIYDISRISPTLCMHSIHIDEDHKCFRHPQRRLNPNMQDVVKK